MKVGTKSVLFGAHCFFIHPFYVAKAWKILYGKRNFKLWVSFFVHDIGYFGKPNMDGEEGEYHPYLGANIMHWLFDKPLLSSTRINGKHEYLCGCEKCMYWYNFTLYHSRFLAKKNNAKFSKLCVADKLAICLTPSWLYIPMASSTGEIKEYMKDFEKSNYTSESFKGKLKFDSKLEWHKAVKSYVQKWVDEHKDMKEDTWTKANRNTNEK